MDRLTINLIASSAILAHQIYAALMDDEILKKNKKNLHFQGFQEFQIEIGKTPILFRRWYLSSAINQHDWLKEPNIVRLKFMEDWWYPIDLVMPVHTTNVDTIQDAVNAIVKMATGKATIKSFKRSRIDYLKIAFDVSGKRI